MTIEPELLEQVIAKHGHLCPGLSMGVHAAELTTREFGEGAETEVVARRDNCVVDALRILTGSVFRKDEDAKVADDPTYTVTRLSDGQTVRLAARPGSFGRDPEIERLREQVWAGEATDEERTHFRALQRTRAEALLARGADDVMDIQRLDTPHAPPTS